MDAMASGRPRDNHEPNDDDVDYIEPIADQVVNRRKIMSLERSLGRLGHASKVQHESVMKLELDMKSAVSVEDLHRALGLAFEEVDHRLEESFRDANIRLLTVFARRDEVTEMQALMANKVNWADHSSVRKGVAELRTYFDSIIQSGFESQIEAMKSTLAKKADAATADKALMSKADVTEVSEMKARLERLEEVTSRTNLEQPLLLQAVADKASADLKTSVDLHKALVATASQQLEGLRDEHRAVAERMAGAESRLQALSEYSQENREVNTRLRNEHESIMSFIGYESTVKTGIASLQDQLRQLDSFSKSARAALDQLATDTKEFRGSAQDNFKGLHAQAAASKQRHETLMTATEMLKRKSREMSKSNANAFKELSEEQEKILEQIAALDRFVKQKQREAQKTPPAGTNAGLRPATPEQGDELRPGMLEQLEKIISGCAPMPDQAPALVDAVRPPLPWYDADGRPCTQGLDTTNPRLDLTNLPRFPSPSPCEVQSRPGSVGGRARLGVTPRAKSARGARK